MLRGSQNGAVEQLPETYTLCGVQTDWLVLYMPPTPLTKVKADMTFGGSQNRRS